MELDDAYSNAPYIADAAAYPPRWTAKAEAYRAAQGDGARLGEHYGPGARQRFDLFLPPGAPAGLIVFVHGGYWKAFDRTVWSHLARGGVEAGWAVALPGYDLCPDVRISDITQQTVQAVTAIAELVSGDIVLTGHSAGGHLVSRMLAPDLLPAEVAARVRRAIPISPVADLRPLLETSMNKILQLDPAEAAAESPVNQPAPRDVDVSVWVGGDERPAFLDQARWLADAWGIGHVVVPGKHHFDVIEALEDRDSTLLGLLTGRG
ncbi:MAG: alpha/beta hydrolase [Pseudomonadota bacterium]